ncbi:MAG: hypothetical protein ACLFPD_01435 [Desulfosudaceae bacterium]
MDALTFSSSTVPSAGVPWGNPVVWQTVNRELNRFWLSCPAAANRLLPLAEDISRQIVRIDPLLNRLCAHTCRWCPDPCCLAATIWLDLADLLRLQLAGPAVPLAQPKIVRGETCRWLGRRGCRLPRTCRPWTCTRYICPTQKRWWPRQSPEEAGRFEEIAARTQNLRRQLRAEFRLLAAGRIDPRVWPERATG